jgi:hypothetical protein
MILVLWVVLGLLLNLVSISRVFCGYYQEGINFSDFSIPIAFWINLLFAPMILFYNLFILVVLTKPTMDEGDCQ